MGFHRFDRLIFVEQEATEGTAETIQVADYVETLDDISYTLTPFTVERNLSRPSYTSIPDYFASTGITSSDTVVCGIEFTFTVEMTSSSASGGNNGNDPAYADLLQACGLEKYGSVKSEAISGITGGPFFHRESVTFGATQPRTISTIFATDTRFYYTGTDPDDTSPTGDVSGATGTTVTSATATGTAYAFNIDKNDGDGSSATVEMNLDGHRVTAKGCRGNVQFRFVAMDRVLMSFTMQGIVHDIDTNAANRNTLSAGVTLPPTFVNSNIQIHESSGTTAFTNALFSEMTLDLGNEVILREDANSTNGWKAGTIVGRAPTITINPDAIAGGTTSSTVFDFYQKMITGTLTKMDFMVGAGLDGNSFHFKMPYLQWSGLADGDRNNFTIYDLTAKLTGGLSGDSIDGSGNQLHDNKGADNEFCLILN